MVVLREAYFKCLESARIHAYDLALEILEQPALAEDHPEIHAFAAVELLAIDLASEIQDYLVPQRRGARYRLETRTLFAHDFERFFDFCWPDADHRPADRDFAHVADGDLGEDLERRAEFDLHRTLGCSFGLEARITCDLEILLAYGFAETFLQHITQDFTPHLVFILPGDNFERYLAGPETGHFRVTYETFQSALHFVIYFSRWQRDVETAFQLTDVFQGCCHYSFLSCWDPGAKVGTRTHTPFGART